MASRLMTKNGTPKPYGAKTPPTTGPTTHLSGSASCHHLVLKMSIHFLTALSIGLMPKSRYYIAATAHPRLIVDSTRPMTVPK